MSGYIVEIRNPRAAEQLLQERNCPDVESAALLFESEASPQNWPAEEIAEYLGETGSVLHVDPETEIEVEARRL